MRGGVNRFQSDFFRVLFSFSYATQDCVTLPSLHVWDEFVMPIWSR